MVDSIGDLNLVEYFPFIHLGVILISLLHVSSMLLFHQQTGSPHNKGLSWDIDHYLLQSLATFILSIIVSNMPLYSIYQFMDLSYISSVVIPWVCPVGPL